MLKSYRVHLIRIDRPESQVITVRSPNETAARTHVLARIGHDWRIASTTLLELP